MEEFIKELENEEFTLPPPSLLKAYVVAMDLVASIVSIISGTDVIGPVTIAHIITCTLGMILYEAQIKGGRYDTQNE